MTSISSDTIRVGLGQDAHRLIVGPPLILGGVEIPSAKGLEGHSDADVLLHAVTDALLGAAGLGDIGEWFPNSDPQWKGAASEAFVIEAVREIHQRGWGITNLDCTISAEQPKLTPHKPAIREKLAELLQLDESRVNVKAKTGELVGPVGRGEAMTAEAIVLLVRNESPPSET